VRQFNNRGTLTADSESSASLWAATPAPVAVSHWDRAFSTGIADYLIKMPIAADLKKAVDRVLYRKRWCWYAV